MVCGLAVLLAGAADLAACVPKAGACVRAAFALAVQTSLALAGALFRGAAEVLNAYVAFFPAGGLSAIDAVFFFLVWLGPLRLQSEDLRTSRRRAGRLAIFGGVLWSIDGLLWA